MKKYKCSVCNDTHYVQTPYEGQYYYIKCDCALKFKEPLQVGGVDIDEPKKKMSTKTKAAIIYVFFMAYLTVFITAIAQQPHSKYVSYALIAPWIIVFMWAWWNIIYRLVDTSDVPTKSHGPG